MTWWERLKEWLEDHAPELGDFWTTDEDEEQP
jgi:hypothetical protein